MLQLTREDQRWYPLKPHPEQLRLVNAVSEGVRFPVVAAGRRSGKTERFKRFITKQANFYPNERYFAAAPTRDQAKKIFWDDLKLLSYSSCHPKKPSESDLIIFLPNGSEIHVIGLDKPQRIEGIVWTGGGIDEIADLKADAWEENIKPALDTVLPDRPDYRAWCWLFGVPDGLNHFYDKAEYAKTADDPLWQFFHWISADILPDDIIDAAMRSMGRRQFNQEYKASFETATGRIYEDYGPQNRVNDTIERHEQLCWFHDFNYTPLSSGIAVMRDKKYYCLDEIILESAVAKNSATEFVERFKKHDNKKVIIYGDPSGKAGEKHGQASDYTEIETVLKNNGWTPIRRVKKAAPAIKTRQNRVRGKICNANEERHLFVNPSKAKYTDKGLATVKLKKGSTFQEDDSEYQHITTAVGYMIDYDMSNQGSKTTQIRGL